VRLADSTDFNNHRHDNWRNELNTSMYLCQTLEFRSSAFNQSAKMRTRPGAVKRMGPGNGGGWQVQQGIHLVQVVQIILLESD
jgi:hypothetical protein